MSEILTIVRHKVKPGKRDEFMQVWEKYVRDYLMGDGGMLGFYYCYDNNDPDAVILVSLAADEESTGGLRKQPCSADYQRETSALRTGQSEVFTATPQWKKPPAHS